LPSFFSLSLKIDSDGDHSTTLSEFLAGRVTLGLGALSDAAAVSLFEEMDDDKSGSLRFYELASYCAHHMAMSATGTMQAEVGD